MERSPCPVFRTGIGESLFLTSGMTCSWTAFRHPLGWPTGQPRTWGRLPQTSGRRIFTPKISFTRMGMGIQDGTEPGLTLLPTNIRFRDGSYSNFNNTDLAGNAGFNEIFPLFSWYVVEADTTRFKNTGKHVIYDKGGPADGSTCGGTTGTVCGNSNIAANLANTAEQISVPPVLRVPGAKYCAVAD